MDFDFTELIKTLGSIASISSGYLNVKKAIVDNGRAKRSLDGDLQGILTPEEAKSILQQPIRASVPNPPDNALFQVIATELLETAMQRISAAQSRLVQAVRGGQISDIEEEDAIARREVCYFLSMVLQHNGGSFPTGNSLERVWRQFRCTHLYPQFGIRSADLPS